jgi:hypothetical protein
LANLVFYRELTIPLLHSSIAELGIVHPQQGPIFNLEAVKKAS